MYNMTIIYGYRYTYSKIRNVDLSQLKIKLLNTIVLIHIKRKI